MAHRFPYVLVGVEIALLLAFFACVSIGDSYLPERGGSGEAASIYLWGGRAGIAFWSLAALWVLAITRLVVLGVRNGKCAAQSMAASLHGIDAVSAGLPVFGVVLGYIILILLA